MTFNLGIKKIWWSLTYEGHNWYLVELRKPTPNLWWVNSETGEVV